MRAVDGAGARTQGKRVLLLGATGTIGRATAMALLECGHEVVCFVRPGRRETLLEQLPPGVPVREGDVTDRSSLSRDAIRGEGFDALVSCLASRTGAPEDAWAIDFLAHSGALDTARQAGIAQMILLSAICVQKPLLEFQKAKLAFEAELIASGMTYSIIRPTAFFKSLSGQIDRLRGGKPFLLFGNGELTACKPISDRDLGVFIAGCLDDQSRWNRILPIGGPGPAVTPREQGEELFRLLNRKPVFKSVPVGLMDAIIRGLDLAGRVSPRLKAKAELARIGRYYATESMLVLDSETGRYDEEATPSFGSDTLFGFYERVVGQGLSIERGDHAVF
ncbi:MAG: NAD(P)H-binding protein [Hoeflea sp.]|uniref:NAD(P)H-binding protein n=1 Tax=Hoeflea sp. TaxID=1940281 RepID=UPI0032EF50A0